MWGLLATSRTGKRSTLTVSAALVCATFISGCTTSIGGIATVDSAQSGTTVANLPVRNGPNGPRSEAPKPNVHVAGSDHGAIDRLAARSVADVNAYWSRAFPETFHGRAYAPVHTFRSYDSTGHGARVCGQRTTRPNAFYCGDTDGIAWDRGSLLPGLRHSFGPMAVPTVLAHEMGHAVQRRAGVTGDEQPAIVREQQADCYTGAYFHSVAADRSTQFQMSTGDGLNRVLGVLNYIRDNAHDKDFTANNAHGSAFDRTTAFQRGFTNGPRTCAELAASDVRNSTTQLGHGKSTQDNDLSVSREALTAVEDSLRATFRDTAARPPRISTSATGCTPNKPGVPARYCPSNNTVGVDLDELDQIAHPPNDASNTSGSGDFAAYAQVASRYALSVQHAAGMPLDGPRAALRTACFVGGWSGSLLEDPVGQRNPVGQLRVEPGDIDEGVAALLGTDGLIAADVDGAQPVSGFARVDAFRTGFQQGFTACGTKYAG